MGVLKEGEVTVDHETDCTSGPLKVNDAYDLYLVKQRSGDYTLIVFMKLQFFFEDGKDGKGKTLSWSAFEKLDFVKKWQEVVRTVWGGRTIKTLANGKTVGIDFRFETQTGGWMFDHWELTVTKVGKGVFSTSSVTTGWGNVSLDSEDLTLVVKKSDPKSRAIFRQRGVAHEFGHMLGLEDEYPEKSPYEKDYASIMNSGETVYPRHDAVYLKWLDTRLREKKIA